MVTALRTFEQGGVNLPKRYRHCLVSIHIENRRWTVLQTFENETKYVEVRNLMDTKTIEIGNWDIWWTPRVLKSEICGFGSSDLNNFGVHQISELNCFDYDSFHLNLPGVHLISEMYNAGLQYNAGLHQFSYWNHSGCIRIPTIFCWCIKFPIWGILESNELPIWTRPVYLSSQKYLFTRMLFRSVRHYAPLKREV